MTRLKHADRDWVGRPAMMPEGGTAACLVCGLLVLIYDQCRKH